MTYILLLFGLVKIGLKLFPKLFFAVLPISLLLVNGFWPSQVIKIVELDSASQKRDVYSSFDSEENEDSLLPTNPFKLLENLRRSNSMEGATTPRDALDDAIKAFDEQS